ncbi:MAG: TetR family transcriptional regulator [Saprospiraceae bacterium]|nr:TetR family transcriptional regulator [Saprospiraceae bacterium]
MITTKEKILRQALALFNTHGITNVSLRAIADAAEISVGNLQYHFKKRDDIVEGLYMRIVERIDRILYLQTDNLLSSFLEVSGLIMNIFFEHRFFFLDMTTIIRSNPGIKHHYAALSKRRAQSFMAIVDLLIDNGILRQPLLADEYAYFYERTEIISNFWFSSVLIQSKELSKDAIDRFSLLISQSIYPYLTDSAKEDYRRNISTG